MSAVFCDWPFGVHICQSTRCVCLQQLLLVTLLCILTSEENTEKVGLIDQALPGNLTRGSMNRNHETVTDELKRHVPGIPRLHKRNKKLFSADLSKGLLP
jgi:hypothetical protein